MDLFQIFISDDDDDDGPDFVGINNPRNKRNQIILSLALGSTAFLSFCLLRVKWASLYAARKRYKTEASVLPELPNTLFGWIWPLFKITDQQILASAGLDAYVFLAFFKMAMKFLVVTLFFSLTVIQPVHDAVPDEDTIPPYDNGTDIFSTTLERRGNSTWKLPEDFETNYFWMYIIFAYLFSGIAIYLIVTETRRIIQLRQEYLGAKTSVTDRTIRLSGIPADLQDEDKIKELIEDLDIGKVERVTLCRKWKELDEAVAARTDTVRRLEEAYTIYLSRKRIGRNSATLPIAQPGPPSPLPAESSDEAEENSQAMNGSARQPVLPQEGPRPQTTIRFGRWKLKSKKVDAIEYYEEKLKQTDERVIELRQRVFQPTPLAFVTMDSVAACQMAIQAVLDPSPRQLIANQSPSPSDILWHNTYLSRRSRMIRSWSITALIIFLTVFWFALLAPIAAAISVETIGRVFPSFKEFLKEHDNISSLISTQATTLLTSLLMVLVPYLYYYLSWYQGMISQRDVELSAISKNFFFTFLNFFVIFTILGTASNFYSFYKKFGLALRDFRYIAFTMALSLQKFLDFYVNFIILQGVGLFPFRLLEMGSVSLYPVYRIGARTPRDYAELVQPPVFSYAFYLPNALLIFIICMVYSVLQSSWQILLAGLIFFAFGHFVYKYQLLYAMDHRQQASGQAWGMICDRLFVGLIFFQVTTAGQLILKQASPRSVLMIPLIGATIWVAIWYDKTYKPLLKFIALRSVKRGEQYTDQETPSPERPESPETTSTNGDELAPERSIWADSDDPIRMARTATRESGRVMDESDDVAFRFVNPSLVVPLEKVWIADQNVRLPPTAEASLIDDEVA